jgi:hypothetical protein
MSVSSTGRDRELIEASLDRIRSELASVVGLEVECDDLKISRDDEKPQVGDGTHLSFKLGLLAEGELRQGCLVMGLAPALEAAGLFLGRPEAERADAVKKNELDDEWKEGLLEVASVFAAAVDVAFRDEIGVDVHACSEGCQGVRGGTVPSIGLSEGNEVLVGRFQWRSEGGLVSDGFLAVDLE